MDGEDYETVARIATGFGGRIRCGKRRSGQVGAGMVRAGLEGVAAKIVMDSGAQPLHQKDGTHYIKPIQLMLAGFSKFDPAVEKKLAAHQDLPQYAVAQGNRKRSSKKQKAVGDLVNVAFYWLLRVSEYTTKQQVWKRKKKRQKLKTRTRQFRHKDCTFFE